MGKFEYGMEMRCYSISVKSLGCDVIVVMNKKVLILRKRRAVVLGWCHKINNFLSNGSEKKCVCLYRANASVQV